LPCSLTAIWFDTYSLLMLYTSGFQPFDTCGPVKIREKYFADH
jgi:hypothetical protein